MSNENEADENAIIINSATKRGAKTLQPPAKEKDTTPPKVIDTIIDKNKVQIPSDPYTEENTKAG